MPPLPNFTGNRLQTRTDVLQAALALLHPLKSYKSPLSARIKLATATAAGFSDTAAQLEGYARPLWLVAPLLHLRACTPDTDLCSTLQNADLDTWVAGLKAGTDPASPEYWGDVSSFDQRMVEMESIAFALLVYTQGFAFAEDEQARGNLVVWLRQINDHAMPKSNWLWFRVLVNLALWKSLGVPREEVQGDIESALETLDGFYIGEGWSSDGAWGEGRRQADYYSGSFAIQFAQLLFVRYGGAEWDAERADRYKSQAREFAISQWRYFAADGAAIPFGRSLTYRFAFAAFWAAVVVAGVELPAPLDKMGTVKGLLMRHLRWWSDKPDIFNTDGTLSIGFLYPNMYLAEDYNSPQSVYWCLKSFIILGLENHPFWSAVELPHPSQSGREKEVEIVWPPRQILCNTSEHHFLLSSGQSTTKRFKAHEAKYGKFAYSSTFGFSVPCGSFLEQIAPDSTLAVSLDDGEEIWKVRWDPYEVQRGEISLGGDTVSTLISYWRPWKHEELIVRTTLIPPLKRWPGWHLRVHCVEWMTPTRDRASSTIQVVDGGFAISAQTTKGFSIFEKPMGAISQGSDQSVGIQGWWGDGRGSLVISESGASGVVDLTKDFVGETVRAVQMQSKASIIRADPNTNLMATRSLIPSTEHFLDASVTSDVKSVRYLVTGVSRSRRQQRPVHMVSANFGTIIPGVVSWRMVRKMGGFN